MQLARNWQLAHNWHVLPLLLQELARWLELAGTDERRSGAATLQSHVV